jgi:hypothetical protein
MWNAMLVRLLFLGLSGAWENISYLENMETDIYSLDVA